LDGRDEAQPGGPAAADQVGVTGDAGDGGSGRGSLTERIRHLFQTVLNPATGRPWTYPEAAAEINARAERLPEAERAGRTISHTYVWQLANGARDNPTTRHLMSLADLFGVSVGYLVDDAGRRDQLAAELEVAAALRDAGISSVANRSRGLSPASIRTVLAMIEHARHLEGLPVSAPGDTPGDAAGG
jgi:transcriptional regulator with XRE-family HTH domain